MKLLVDFVLLAFAASSNTNPNVVGAGVHRRRNDNGGAVAGRGGFGVSSQFWGQIFHIHKHYHEVVRVDWDADDDRDECSAVTKSCTSRQSCCKGLSCINWKCGKCAGEGESCERVKNCCSKDQKCLNDKCTDFCVKAWNVGCSTSVPCCDPVFPCLKGACTARPGACQPTRGKPCNSQYPCCRAADRCIGDICKACGLRDDPCQSTSDCCVIDPPKLKCKKGFCRS